MGAWKERHEGMRGVSDEEAQLGRLLDEMPFKLVGRVRI